MRVLIIGNGFDIEHKLETKYVQFLEFVKWYREETKCKGKYFDKYNELKKDNAEIIEELDYCLNGNKWIDYFINRRNHEDSSWIDFENEISNVIQLLDLSWQDYISNARIEVVELKPNTEFIQYLELFYSGYFEIPDWISGRSYYLQRESLQKWLNRLTRALEIYLYFWEESKEIQCINPNIVSIHPTNVISFNYTHTYEKIYAKRENRIEYCYPHGSTIEKYDNWKSDTEKVSRLVLGIDDYESDLKNNDFGMRFKKYYQQINSEVDMKYYTWIDTIKEESGEEHFVYVFGHSLDVTDRDILEPLLSAENVTIVVFYFNNVHKAKLEGNIIQLIGKEKVLKKASQGEILFVHQAPSMNYNGEDMEFLNDIDTIRKHPFNISISLPLILKIKDRINNNDAEYFANCGNLIMAAGALNGYSFMDSETHEKWRELVDVCLQYGFVEPSYKSTPRKFEFDGESYVVDGLKPFSKEVNEIIKGKKTDVTELDEWITNHSKAILYNSDDYLELLKLSFQQFLDDGGVTDKMLRQWDSIVLKNKAKVSVALESLDNEMLKHANKEINKYMMFSSFARAYILDYETIQKML